MQYAADALEQDGVCEESVWPYVAQLSAGHGGQGPPAGGATMAAMRYRVRSLYRIPRASVAEFKRVLDSGRCAAFAVDVFNSFVHNSQAIATGKIVTPYPNELGQRWGHAMCMVGYVDDTSNPALGGGRFIVRNSWGDYFGKQSWCGLPPGHGTIPYVYITNYGRDCGIAIDEM